MKVQQCFVPNIVAWGCFEVQLILDGSVVAGGAIIVPDNSAQRMFGLRAHSFSEQQQQAMCGVLHMSPTSCNYQRDPGSAESI